MTHSPEPWKTLKNTIDSSQGICDANGVEILFARGPGVRCFASAYGGIHGEDARRIVACVEFLAGVPQQVLEDMLAAHAYWHSPPHDFPPGHEKSIIDDIRRHILRYHELNPHTWKPPHYGWAGALWFDDEGSEA